MTETLTDSTSGRDHAQRFIDYIRGVVADDPGRRAALRHALGRPPEQAARAHAVVAPWLPDEPGSRGLDPARERAYYAIAALLAAAPPQARTAPSRAAGERPAEEPTVGAADHKRPGKGEASRHLDNLGVSLAAAVRTGRMREDTAETRLHLLTRQGREGLHRHLVGTVHHMQSGEVPLDWHQLLQDLARWDRSRDRIAKRWLQSYYRARYADGQRGETPTPDVADPQDTECEDT